MIGRIEKRVDLFDRHTLVHLSYLNDCVASAYGAFPQNAQVEPSTSARCQQCRHQWLAQSNGDAIAGNARLSNLKQRVADPITVTDAHRIVGQSFDGEVLAELSVDEVGALQLLLPMAIRFNLVDEDRPLFASMSAQVALTVSL